MEEDKELKKGEKAYLKRIVNQFQSEAKNSLEAFNKMKENLIGGKEGSPSLIEKFKSTEDELEQINEKLQNVYSKIYEENENGEILHDLIFEFKDTFENKKNEIIKIQGEIIEYQKSLFGIQKEDGTETKGVKQNIDDYLKKLDGLYKSNVERQDQLFDKIEGLLKGASTVALAEAFNKHKESFNLSNIVWVAVFIISIASMMTLSVIAFVSSNYNTSEMWKYTLGNLPFLVGAVWLAIYSSKQRSQNIRLQQEYAFKEDVAKIYYGLKQEIEELGDSELGQKLNDKVLSIVIETVSYNPSETLENINHGDKGPIIEMLKGLTEMVKNTKKSGV